MTALATQAGILFRKHPYAAPPYGTGVPMTTPSFMRLRGAGRRELVDKGAGTSLVERKEFWRLACYKAAGSSGGKRKGAPGTGGQRTPPALDRIGDGGGRPAFKARIHERSTPPGVCDHVRQRFPFPRENCVGRPQPSSHAAVALEAAAKAAASPPPATSVSSTAGISDIVLVVQNISLIRL